MLINIESLLTGHPKRRRNVLTFVLVWGQSNEKKLVLKRHAPSF